MKKAALLLVALSFILVSCPNEVPPAEHLGSLLLTFSATELAAKTIKPSLDMNVASYNVSGSGPDSATFSQTGIAGTSVAQNALLVGAWTIVVDAFNAAHDLIGSGSTAVAIEEGETTAASVMVTPLSGTGTLTIGIAWTPAALISAPSVVATLTPAGGADESLLFTIGVDSASYSSGKTLNAGYYNLALVLKDGSVAVWGFSEAVRILRDQTTAASFSLTSADLHTGGVNLTIVPSLQNPITVTFSGQQSQIPPGTDMTITATTSENPVAYQWYLGGVPLSGQTNSSITIGSSLTQGNYRLDLGVTKGNVLSSGSVVFSVLSAPGAITQTNTGESGTALDIYLYGGTEFAAKPVYTIWAEDMSGVFIQDFFVCNSPGTNVYPFSSTWEARPQTVPYWAHKSCREDPYGYVGNTSHITTGMYLGLPRADAMGGEPIPADLDAVTGATRSVDFEVQTHRKSGGVSQFKVLLEINEPFDYNTYYDSGTYYPGGQPSLVYGATIDTSSGQTLYTMSLLGTGHGLGSDGALQGAGNCTTALNIVKTVIIHVK